MEQNAYHDTMDVRYTRDPIYVGRYLPTLGCMGYVHRHICADATCKLNVNRFYMCRAQKQQLWYVYINLIYMHMVRCTFDCRDLGFPVRWNNSGVLCHMPWCATNNRSKTQFIVHVAKSHCPGVVCSVVICTPNIIFSFKYFDLVVLEGFWWPSFSNNTTPGCDLLIPIAEDQKWWKSDMRWLEIVTTPRLLENSLSNFDLHQ